MGSTPNPFLRNPCNHYMGNDEMNYSITYDEEKKKYVGTFSDVPDVVFVHESKDGVCELMNGFLTGMSDG